MVEAIFYVLRTAVAWRDLPPCYGPWNSVYTRWRRWCALGLCRKSFASCPETLWVAFVSSIAPTSSSTSSVAILPEAKAPKPSGELRAA